VITALVVASVTALVITTGKAKDTNYFLNAIDTLNFFLNK
jgi:hypothetical protein